jgi:ribosomal protein RSM22 (predicted rRNA methylase)
MISLPPALVDAITELLAATDAPHLRNSSHLLTDAYRQPISQSLYNNPQTLYAYLAVRMPATYAVIHRVLEEYTQMMPVPLSLLDIGAGPGTVGWAAQALWPSLEKLASIEASPHFAAIGQRLCTHSPTLSHRNSNWHQQNILQASFSAHDMITASYVLGEVEENQQTELVERAWDAATTALVLIEPGTPQGYHNIIRARQTLIERGAFILAPCPHQKACPKDMNNWCHFTQRLERSSLHRLSKDVSLPYEDEKFSYLSAVSSPPSQAITSNARIVAHPRKHTGHVSLELCTPEGEIERRIVPKSMKDMYHRAKKSRWGELWPF